MKSFKSYLESQGKSKSTITYYMRYALDFISWLDKDHTEIEHATAKEVLSYLNHLQNKGLDNKTRNIRLNVIKLFFNWQVQQEQRESNPVSHVKIRGTKRQKLYPILSKEELEQLYLTYQVPSEKDPKSHLNWFKTMQLSKARNKTLLSLIINQGLTTAEISKLTLTDLKLKEGKVYIEGGRKSAARTLELKSNQIIELMEYQYQIRPTLLNYQKEETNLLFLSVPVAGQKYATGKGNLQIWKGLTREMKEKHKVFQNFKQVRASVITHWLKQYNLREVQYMAGHKYVSSTEKYLANQAEDLRSDIDRFHPN